MVGIKAIETHYKGHRFRSRLEARWAVFFDSLGWEWKYEHQGYMIGWHESNRVPWLPDFELTLPSSQKFYVEVKGDPNFFSDGLWLDRLDFGGGPPGFADSGDGIGGQYHSYILSESKPLLLLGDIPKQPSRIGLGPLLLPVVYHDSGICIQWCVVEGDRLVDPGPLIKYFMEDSFHIQEIGNFQPHILGTAPRHLPDIKRALNAARAARFEHGESG